MTYLAIPASHSTRELYASPESVQTAEPTRRLLSFGREMGLSTSWAESALSVRSDDLAQRFRRLAERWRADTRYVSSLHDMVLHPAYQEIIGMGERALPFIFQELARRPDHWFWALRAITGEDPTPPEDRGTVAAMARDWLRWAERQGIRYGF